MSAQRGSIGEPVCLFGSRLVFTDWRYVLPPAFAWLDRQGSNVGVKGTQGPWDAVFQAENEARGIRITARAAERTGPVILPEEPWEADGVNLFTVLRDGEIYKAWGSTGWGDLSLCGRRKGSRMVCYYESRDGITWTRPHCGVVAYEGSRDNNLVDLFPGQYNNLWGSVFLDADAEPSERYKFIVSDSFTEEECSRYLLRRPGDTDAIYRREDARLRFGVRGAVSPDGIHWRILPEPLVLMHEDGLEHAYYDPALRKYVAFWRDWSAECRDVRIGDLVDTGGIRWLRSARRAIGRSETGDFQNFPLSEIVLEPDPRLSPSQVYYAPCKTAVPGAPNLHLLFPTVWDTADDTTSVLLAVSRDGRQWHRLSETPVLGTDTFGRWDGGCIFAVPNLMELPNGDFALPYTGFDVPHKYPRVQAGKATGYAVWPKGRLTALEAPEEGCFTTVSFFPPGRRILINAVTSRAGYILAEAVDIDGRVLPGCSFDEAEPVVGDQFRAPLRWSGGEPNIEPSRAVALRFRLKQASLFSIDFA